ncbi:MAG: hypothetical protein ACPHQP_01520, partial [Longimicrobiales bacterium]
LSCALARSWPYWKALVHDSRRKVLICMLSDPPKLGYGTVSEVWREGLPFAWVTRADSREMSSLEAFAEDELSGWLVPPEHFRSGDWIDDLESLVDMPRRPHPVGGAHRIAEILIEQGGHRGRVPVSGSVGAC